MSERPLLQRSLRWRRRGSGCGARCNTSCSCSTLFQLPRHIGNVILGTWRGGGAGGCTSGATVPQWHHSKQAKQGTVNTPSATRARCHQWLVRNEATHCAQTRDRVAVHGAYERGDGDRKAEVAHADGHGSGASLARATEGAYGSKSASATPSGRSNVSNWRKRRAQSGGGDDEGRQRRTRGAATHLAN